MISEYYRRLYKNIYGYMQLFYSELIEYAMVFISIIPGRLGIILRRKFINFRMIGKNTFIQEWSRFYHPGNIIIGNNSGIGLRTVMNGAGGISIGNNVVIGPEVMIWTQNHIYANPKIPIMYQGWEYKPVIIEDDVWIGARVIILPGVKIGKGSIVGAGSVVTRDVAPSVICMGFPARKIGERIERKSNTGDK